MNETPENSMSSLIHVGWREWMSLPDIGLPAVKAKIDTGARTSALHTFWFESYKQDGFDMVRMKIHPLQKRKDLYLNCVAPLVDERYVRDSGGHRELRPVIKTSLVLAGQIWPIEITLTNREDMVFRMLLGRTAMNNRIIVNPVESYLAGRKLQKYYRENPEILIMDEI